MYMVVIAQLAEHRIVVPSVVGSSPTLHPKNKEQPLWLLLFFVGMWLGEKPINRGPREF